MNLPFFLALTLSPINTFFSSKTAPSLSKQKVRFAYFFCLFTRALTNAFSFFRSRQLSRVFACALQHRLLSRLLGSLARVLCRQCVPTCCCLAARLRAVSARLGAASAILLVDVCVFLAAARAVSSHAVFVWSARTHATLVLQGLPPTRYVARARRRCVAPDASDAAAAAAWPAS